MLTNAQRNKLAAGLGAIAVGVVALVLGELPGRTHQDDVLAALSDAGVPHTGSGGTTTDLLTEEVPGGAQATTLVNVTGYITDPEVIGPPQFDIISTTTTWKPPVTEVVIVVENKTGAPMRFAGFLHYTVPPPDAGVDAPADAP